MQQQALITLIRMPLDNVAQAVLPIRAILQPPLNAVREGRTAGITRFGQGPAH